MTREAIAPASVYGGALAAKSIHVTPVADRDAVASNPEWTASNTEVTLCGPGEAPLGTGVIFTEPGNKEVTWLRVAPILSPIGNGVSGEIASNSGGTSKAQVGGDLPGSLGALSNGRTPATNQIGGGLAAERARGSLTALVDD